MQKGLRGGCSRIPGAGEEPGASGREQGRTGWDLAVGSCRELGLWGPAGSWG